MTELLKINGVDFTPFLASGGITYTRNDVDSAESGELADGTLRRDRMIIRPTLEIKLLGRFSNDDISTIMTAIEPQWLEVYYPDPRLGGFVTRWFYTNAPKVQFVSADKAKPWKLESIQLVARGVAGDGRAKLQ